MRSVAGLARVLVGAVLWALAIAEGGVIYVDDDAPADYDHIQAAIDAAVAGDEIVVRPGTYYEHIDLHGKAVTVRSTDPLDPAVVESTIIDGGAAGTVVTCRSGEGPDTVLNGLTITNGRHLNFGGGMGISGRPRVIHCRIIQNVAIGRGAGVTVATSSASPLFARCTFAGNVANSNGGGLYIENGMPALVNCTFVGNTAKQGGGIDVNGGTVTLTNCQFVQNSASTYGGGLHLVSGPSSPVNLTNCVFVGNRAGLYGGGTASWGVRSPYYPHVYFVNCTFAGNGAGAGRSVACDSENNNVTYMLHNSILWDVDAIRCDRAGVYVLDSDVMGLSIPILRVIDADPSFVEAPDPGPDGEWGTSDDDHGDLHLQPGSPCIDAARNTDVPADAFDLNGDGDITERTPFDLDGHPRFLDDPDTPDAGVPDPPHYPHVVDMGTYEFIPVIPGDFDRDGDVDPDDFLVFQACVSGPAIPHDGTRTCQTADFDKDGDVDQSDFGLFQRCWSGANQPADPNCGH
ncbi:MAG TPA: right-handed parallel beta-helix repeat-containing protein [Phycisphaerae bacterium]|nr:right-handed parallel beta-helix repeat-containing protein [Phycisphaerae bacterium]HRY71435.1 right-handed parallel beta-helix repeat-containing protein [Phycisphaerae bacterium]HSA29965.1 right-handed parallel beta-helix repeat-containing protein [Phycisphaerae bacterium]